MLELKRKLTENIKCVQGRIEEACGRVNRSPDEVKLIAVTKYAGLDVLKTMPDVGLTDLGESRAQELTKRAAVIHEFLSRRARDLEGGAMPRPRWHMIGHLQRNKVKHLLPWTDMVHSVDSLRLAEEIDHQASALGREIDVLMQVNCAGETTKFGVAVGAATHLAELIAPLPHLNLCGLMAMAPHTDDRGAIYDCFQRCRELFDEIVHEVGVGEQFRHLSMGMSNDFEIAIACGATMVRVGTALLDGLLQTA